MEIRFIVEFLRRLLDLIRGYTGALLCSHLFNSYFFLVAVHLLLLHPVIIVTTGFVWWTAEYPWLSRPSDSHVHAVVISDTGLREYSTLSTMNSTRNTLAMFMLYCSVGYMKTEGDSFETIYPISIQNSLSGSAASTFHGSLSWRLPVLFII